MNPHNDSNLGQILASSAFGQALTEQAKHANIIVEIGTWKGLGTTLCLHLGMTPNTWLFTVEQDKDHWKLAFDTWAQEPRIICLHGRTSELLDTLPSKIDLLVLDGGDDTGWSDFESLSPRARVIAMDDTNEVKNKKARETLLHANWKTLHDVPSERYGWAIFERPSP